MSVALAKENNTLSATLLITGCCIGAGMIGLPVVSAAAGFLPSSLALLISYLFATSTGLILLEATLWFKEKINLLTLADFAFGKAGKAVTWLLFLFLFYCLFVAYIDGGGQLFAGLLTALSGQPIPREAGIILCVGFVGAIVYAGTGAITKISRLFLVGLAASYCALVAYGLPHVDPENLQHAHLQGAISALPVLLVCFGYQNLIPTLADYAQRNVSTIRKAIFIGNLIPLCLYLLWNYVILGILSSPEEISSGSQNELVTGLLENASRSPYILFFANTFSFFAVITPFMGNSIAFVDFLKDGLKNSHQLNQRPVIYAMVLLPPTILSLCYPHLFLRALSYAGGFADVLLFGILPVLIVWIGRYKKGMQGPYQVVGGKIFLALILLLSIGLLLIRN